ncbi:MAG: Nif3-like dinuclear metal center hexameric protein [Gammaproteobacteria bacterium]
MTLKELVDYTNELLAADSFRDYAPNGLQVEGRTQVNLIVSGVTASLELVEAGIAAGADALLVHHGYFWKGESARVTGMKRRRLQRLLGTDTSLLAYHLPLDAHPELGNNAQLARVLGFETAGPLGGDDGTGIGCFGALPGPLDGQALAALIQERLGRKPLHIPGRRNPVHTLGWCTGAAQSYIEAAVERGLDAFISGEISEQTVHVVRECGIHYFSAGHHATERYGVRALGEHLAGHFGIRHRFIDIANPV